MKSHSPIGTIDSAVGNWFDQFWSELPFTRLWFPSFCFAGAFACLIGQGQAQELNRVATNDPTELSLEELVNIQVDSVLAASKYEQKVTQAPASISIVTADEIKKFGHGSLADVLRSVRGLYVADDRNYAYLGIRGYLRPGDYNSRLLVLLDGHRMNENVYDSAEFGGAEGTVNVDLIDHVEVIRGPSSSLYGSSAFFGVINIVTKRGRQFDGVEASVEAGSFDTYKGSFSFGKKFKSDVEWLFSGSYHTSEGPGHLYYPEFDQRISNDPRATNNGVAVHLDGEEAHQFFSSLSYGDFTLSGFFNSRNKRIPTASFDTVFNDGREETTDNRGYVDLKCDHSYNDNLRLRGRAYYDNYTYYGTYPENHADPGDPPAIVLNKDKAVGEWIGTEWQLNANVFDRHMLIAGAEYRENLRQEQLNYDEDPRAYYVQDNRSSRTVSLFAQADVAIVTNLLLNAGVRYDHYFEGFGSAVNPRLGLIYSPWKTTTFKALYGEAFRAPNVFEQFYNTAQATRPPLKPEKIRTYELAYEQYLAHHYRLNLSAYYCEVEDLISQVATPEDDIYYDNLGRADAKGIEFEVEGKYNCGLLARASYALQRTEDATTHTELTSSPRHLVKLNLSVPLYKDKLLTSLELQYQSSSKTLLGHRADDFLIANLTVFSRELVKNLELSASIYNLFDTKYGYPGAEDHLQDVIRQDGRRFRVKLTYKY